jgi:hypothetical protein
MRISSKTSCHKQWEKEESATTQGKVTMNIVPQAITLKLDVRHSNQQHQEFENHPGTYVG